MQSRNVILIGLLGGLLLIFFLNPFDIPSWSPISRITGIQIFRNPTVSMEPTLSRGSMIVASAWPYLFREPQTGDIVVFRFPPDPSVLYVKRIVAAGGSSVSVTKCNATVDGRPLSEPYAVAGGDEGRAPMGSRWCRKITTSSLATTV
jgi:signal peptidase I